MAARQPSKRAAVLGFPVCHSLSPRLHRYWLRHYAIDGQYDALEIAPGDLEKTFAGLRAQEYSGINLTIPHKEQALLLVDEITDVARRIGAVNTVIIKDGRLTGTNTDAYGFMAHLNAQCNSGSGKALVLGAGGAARAVCAGLLGEGWQVVVASRTRSRADAIAEGMKPDAIDSLDWVECEIAMKDAALLVNATPLGMKGQEPLTLSLASLPRHAAVYDIVYNPLETVLIASARAAGHPVITGLGMLLYQAQPAFESFFGVRPEVTAELEIHMREALS